jgi:3'(2'), 5'-bisphosphate nucleotidase
MVVSRSRTPAIAAAVGRELGFDGARLGSAGAKTMAVVLGHADVYLHAGGQHQWDSAAPIAVARAAGLHTSRIDGSPFVYNARDTWLPDLLVCQPHLADDILRVVRNFTAN